MFSLIIDGVIVSGVADLTHILAVAARDSMI